MSKFYSKIYKLFAGLIRKLYRIKIVGKENEPPEGPFIVCANHISYQDVAILAASLKHQVRFLAKAELFKIPIFGRFIRACGAYPVERGKGDVGSIKNTLKLIEEGEVVGIYPQGHRYGGIHPADSDVKGGIGFILTKKRVPVLPVAIQTKNFKVRLFRKTKVIIGKPIMFDEFPEVSGKRNDLYNEISSAVFSNICGLLDSTVSPPPKNGKFLTEGAKEGLIPRLVLPSKMNGYDISKCETNNADSVNCNPDDNEKEESDKVSEEALKNAENIPDTEDEKNI